MSINWTSKSHAPRPERRELFSVLLLIIELIVFSVISNNFLTLQNLVTVLRNATDLAVVAIGMTMVIIMGGIDISVGSALGVVAIVIGWMLQANVHPIIIIVGALAIGSVIGLINGVLITYTNIPAIIATLGVSNILRAGVFALLGGQWLTGLPPVFSWLTAGDFLGIPSSFFLLLLLYATFWYFMTYRPTGRHIYAVGNGLEAANLVGINTNKTRLLIHGMLGALVGFAAILYVGRMGIVEMTVGNDLPLSVIAAVVIGGTSIMGGSGSLVGTLAGVLFMAVMRNGIVLLGIPSLWVQFVIGLLILISVGVDLVISRRSKRRQEMQLAQQRKATLTLHNTERGLNE